MGKNLILSCMMMGALVLCGCGAQKSGRATDREASEMQRQTNQSGLQTENDPVSGQKIVKKAHSALGTPYVFGGAAPGGFDCSGLVKWSYKSVGVNLPRTAKEQSQVGKNINKIEDMRAGDIVAFRHPKRGYHTGIYVGEGKFIHSPRRRTHVRVNSLTDPYFSSTLLGARRVNLSGGETVVAQAEKLEDYLAQRSRLSVATRNIAKSRHVVAETPKSNVVEKSHKKNTKHVAENASAKKASSVKNAKAGKEKASVAKKNNDKSLKTKVANNASKAAKDKNVKAGKTNAAHNRSVAQNASKAKTVQHKSTAANKKSVSMLNQKKQKTAARKHS